MLSYSEIIWKEVNQFARVRWVLAWQNQVVPGKGTNSFFVAPLATKNQCSSFAECRARMVLAHSLQAWVNNSALPFPLPFLLLLLIKKNDRIRALETIIGCRLALEYLYKPSYNMQNFHPKNLTLDYTYSCLIFYLCTLLFLHLEWIYWHIYLYIFQQGIFSAKGYALFWWICGALLFCQRDIVKSRLEEEEENCLSCPSILIHIMIFSLWFVCYKYVEFQRVQFQLSAMTQL